MRFSYEKELVHLGLMASKKRVDLILADGESCEGAGGAGHNLMKCSCKIWHIEVPGIMSVC